eukprot:snap_masked-scaffold132_size323655-processed-gene-2.16 protein:Tk07915 transcript:snap_masked-scaffold132_size323655-processed-gene-2.16-mRNA-1 annotation:"hypothetical protein DAPPUDRAFT_301173"
MEKSYRHLLLHSLLAGVEAAGLEYSKTPTTWRSYGHFAQGQYTTPSLSIMNSLVLFATLTTLLGLSLAHPQGAAPHHGGGGYKEGPALYNYAYAVHDDYSGANFGQEEKRDGYATSGQYHVALPDGRIQTVTYSVADEYSGYVADVSYSGKATYGHGPHKGDIGHKARVLIGHRVGHGLDAAIGQGHVVLAAGGVSVALLLLAKVGSGVVIVHGIGVVVEGRPLFVATASVVRGSSLRVGQAQTKHGGPSNPTLPPVMIVHKELK